MALPPGMGPPIPSPAPPGGPDWSADEGAGVSANHRTQTRPAQARRLACDNARLSLARRLRLLACGERLAARPGVEPAERGGAGKKTADMCLPGDFLIFAGE